MYQSGGTRQSSSGFPMRNGAWFRCVGQSLLLLLAVPAPAAARERDIFKGVAPASLPEPNPLSVQVRQGETVQIRLSAFSLTSPIVRYRIRQKPALGTLSPAAFVNGKTGLVNYTPLPGGWRGGGCVYLCRAIRSRRFRA